MPRRALDHGFAVGWMVFGIAGCAVAEPPAAGASFRDCEACPEVVVVPAGRLLMGYAVEVGEPADESPQVAVDISPFGLTRYEVTRGEFAAFVADTYWGKREPKPCHAYAAPGVWTDESSDVTWENPGFEQADDHPVVCVSWDDAVAYAAWMSARTGERDRLPTEAEFEYAHRSGVDSRWYWGGAPTDACRYANLADSTLLAARPARGDVASCVDRVVFTSAVGSREPNAWGFYDMAGNVSEWVMDCWKGTHEGKPTDGTAYWFDGCPQRRLKGGSWASGPSGVEIPRNTGFLPGERWVVTGFRLARDLSSPDR